MEHIFKETQTDKSVTGSPICFEGSSVFRLGLPSDMTCAGFPCGSRGFERMECTVLAAESTWQVGLIFDSAPKDKARGLPHAA